MSLRAFYEQENNYGVTDRIEIYDVNYTGDPVQFVGRAPSAFDFDHREITGEQREYLSIFENQIIMGVLDLYVRVDSTEKESIIFDMADAPPRDYMVEWKRDGVSVWKGYPHGRIVEYPERKNYNVKIQFRDFEILKSADYPLSNIRQPIIKTIDGILDYLGLGSEIKSSTSWEEFHISTLDFLQDIFHDTFALRQYAGDGFSQDQPIKYYEALLRALDPMLVMYQWQGFEVRQISALKSPDSVGTVTYLNGEQDSFTNRNLEYSLSTNADNPPSAKVSTNNASYPALKRASYEFQHRSGSSNIEFETQDEFQNPVFFDDRTTATASTQFSGSGDERLFMNIRYQTNDENNLALFSARAGTYALDTDSSWQRPNDHSQPGTTADPEDFDTDTGDILLGQGSVLFAVDMPVMLQGDLPSGFNEDETYFVVFRDAQFIRLSSTIGGSPVIPEDQGSGTIGVNPVYISEPVELNFATFRADLRIRSNDIPAMANTSIQVALMIQDTADRWYAPFISIINPTQAGESIEYRLTQENDYPEEITLSDSFFGDGPYQYSRSSYRYSENTADVTGGFGITNVGWRRQGETNYIPYSRLKLNEVLDYQRVRQVKKTFDINGEFDPSSVILYRDNDYMYVGGSYNGRWRPIGVKIEENHG